MNCSCNNLCTNEIVLDDVDRFALGEMSELEMQAVERHLASCAVCRDEWMRQWRLRESIVALWDVAMEDAASRGELVAQIS